MKPQNLYIAGLATRVPQVVPITEAIRRGWYDADRLAVDGWTGAAVAGTESAPELAAEAAVLALKRAGLDADRIALLLHAGTFHQGPDIWYAAHYVQDRAVGTAIPAIGIDQGCTGMLDAVQLAYGYLAVNPGATAALVTGGDNFGTALMDRWNYATGWSSNRGSILGDAGSAVVLSTEPGPLRIRAMAASSLAGWERLYRGDEPLFPPGAATGTKVALGERMAAYADRDPALRRAVAEELADARTALARRVMAEAGVGPADITRVTHVFTGHPRYLEHMLLPLGIDPARGMLELGRAHGHLGVNDQFFALSHLLETGAVGPGDHILMMGNGVGISLVCAVVEILARPAW